jgi:hypothetical protein
MVDMYLDTHVPSGTMAGTCRCGKRRACACRARTAWFWNRSEGAPEDPGVPVGTRVRVALIN